MIKVATENTIIRVSNTIEKSTSLKKSMIRKSDIPKIEIKVTSLKEVN